VKSRNAIQFLFVLAMTVILVACSGTSSGPNPPGPISVSFLNQPATSLNVSASTGVIATVSNDSNNAGVTWKVSCGGSSCGSISPGSTPSGSTANYVAPDVIPTPATVMITATSITDSTKSVSASITIKSATPPSIAVSFVTQPPSSMVAGTASSLAASVNNDAKNGGVTWSVNCGSSQCGSFNPTSTGSGSATTYTAPGVVPAPATVTVIATSITDASKSASATISITSAPPPALSDGTYVFQFSGQDNNNNYYVAGAFAIKDGVISGGEQDFTDGVALSSDQLVASNCSITTTEGNLQIVLATASGQLGVDGVETLRGAVVSSKRILISEFDSFAAATGSIDLQTNTAAPSGGYAFAINGIDGTQNGNQLVIGGVLNFNGTSLSTTNSVFDFNDQAGTVLQAQSFDSGSITAPDAFGRVTISLIPNAVSGVPGFNLTGYLVDGSRIQLLESQGDALNADLGGTALAQGTNTGKFGQTSIVNTTYVFGSQGQDTNGPVVLGGAFIFAPNGTASGLLAFNDFINVNGNSFSDAIYSVDPSGRATISQVIPSKLGDISLTFQLYLDGNGNALALGADNIQQTTGLAYRQNGLADYEGSFAIAVQGFLNGPNYEQPYAAVGPVTISADGFDGYTDYTSQDQALRYPLPTPFDNYAGTPLTGLENTSNGLLNLTGLNSLGFSQPGGFGYYPIDSNRVLAIEVDHNGIGFLMLEGTSPGQSKP
jgi:hypothetical protein